MVLCKQDIVTFERWFEIYDQINKREIPTQRYGYGIRVDSKLFPDLELLRKHLPFKDHFFFLISHRKNREFPIHVDGIPGQRNAASINWPIINCDERSPTEWFETDKQVEWLDLDNSYFMKNVHDAVLTHSEPMLTRLSKPYLFRSDLLHRGFCQLENSERRVIVKWELEYDSWDSACQEFQNKNYI